MIRLIKDDGSYIVRRHQDDVSSFLICSNGLDDLTIPTPKGGGGHRPLHPQGCLSW